MIGTYIIICNNFTKKSKSIWKIKHRKIKIKNKRLYNLFYLIYLNILTKNSVKDVLKKSIFSTQFRANIRIFDCKLDMYDVITFFI